MMSYTMACTSSCSIGGRLIRRMSPWTRISGGKPADRWRSEALFLTAKARSSVMSIYNSMEFGAGGRTVAVQQASATQFACQNRAPEIAIDYEPVREGVARRVRADRQRGARSRARAQHRDNAGGSEDVSPRGYPFRV